MKKKPQNNINRMLSTHVNRRRSPDRRYAEPIKRETHISKGLLCLQSQSASETARASLEKEAAFPAWTLNTRWTWSWNFVSSQLSKTTRWSQYTFVTPNLFDFCDEIGFFLIESKVFLFVIGKKLTNELDKIVSFTWGIVILQHSKDFFN